MKYCIPDCIIMDQDSAFMSSLMNYLFMKFNIKIKTVAPYNHQSLQAEHGIKLLLMILTKHLTNLGQTWPKFLSLSTFAYNTFNTPNFPTKKAHMAKLRDLLKALLTNRLKISPKKCQLFKMELQYMGNTIFIKDREVCVKPLRSYIKIRTS